MSHSSAALPSLVVYGPRLGLVALPHARLLAGIAPPALLAELHAAAAPNLHHYFTVDDQLLYLSFFKDTGPLNVACL